MARQLSVDLRVTDLPAVREWLERVRDFINEYAWHTSDCAAIDADGEWRKGNQPCSCGYDEALARIQEGVTESEATCGPNAGSTDSPTASTGSPTHFSDSETRSPGDALSDAPRIVQCGVNGFGHQTHNYPIAAPGTACYCGLTTWEGGLADA